MAIKALTSRTKEKPRYESARVFACPDSPALLALLHDPRAPTTPEEPLEPRATPHVPLQPFHVAEKVLTEHQVCQGGLSQ